MITPPLDTDEADLIRRARWGDRDAFDALYRLHASAVYTLAYRLGGSAAAAEDITQDAFLKMLQFLGGFRDGMPLRPWLKRVAANAAIDRLRRDRPHVFDVLSEDAEDAGVAVGGPADAAPYVRVDAAGLLRRLPPLSRAVVWLHEVEGWTHAEIGTRFGQSPSWSKSIISRALQRLRTALDAATDMPT